MHGGDYLAYMRLGREGETSPGPVRHPHSLLRPAIAASLAEGAAVGVVYNVLEQWLVPILQLRLEATASAVFMLTLVPLAINAMIGPWSGRIISLLGGYRRVSLNAGYFQAACLALLAVPACVPHMPGALAAGMVCAIAIPASMSLSQPAWFAWTGTFVPRVIQGRYFGMRNRLLMIVKISSAAVFAGVISSWPMAHDWRGMAVILLAAAVARVLAVAMLLRLPDLPARPRPAHSPSAEPAAVPADFRTFIRGLLGSHFGRWSIVWSLLFFGFMVAGPAFSLYMLAPVQDGGLGLAGSPFMFTALVMSCQVMRLVAYPMAGWVIDRIGPMLVLRWAIIGITVVPMSWALVRHVPTLIAVETANGLFWCAAECSAMVIILSCHPDPSGRIRLIGYHQTMLGIVQAVAVGLGMFLLPLLPPLEGSGFRSLFLLSVLLRVPAAVLAWTLLPRFPIDVRRQLRGLWRQFPGLGLVATTSRGAFMIMRKIIDEDTMRGGEFQHEPDRKATDDEKYQQRPPVRLGNTFQENKP